jgi:hypothetical protein
MTAPVDPIIRHYADGEISANQAATLLADHATVGDVIAMLRAAGLEPPRLPPEQERAELARAMAILGLTPRPH